MFVKMEVKQKKSASDPCRAAPRDIVCLLITQKC